MSREVEVSYTVAIKTPGEMCMADHGDEPQLATHENWVSFVGDFALTRVATCATCNEDLETIFAIFKGIVDEELNHASQVEIDAYMGH